MKTQESVGEYEDQLPPELVAVVRALRDGRGKAGFASTFGPLRPQPEEGSATTLLSPGFEVTTVAP